METSAPIPIKSTGKTVIEIKFNGEPLAFEIERAVDTVAPGFDEQGPLLLCQYGDETFIVRPKVV